MENISPISDITFIKSNYYNYQALGKVMMDEAKPTRRCSAALGGVR